MSRIKSATQHTFALAPSADIPRSYFNRSENYKTTMYAGFLTPVYFDDVIPGDTFNVSLSAFARILSPLKFPILDNLYLDIQFWYVPLRLVYEDYEKFFGSSKGREGNWEYDDSHLIPGISSGENGFMVGSIFDKLGAPVGVPNIRVIAPPFRAYNLIYADWYLPSSYGLDSPEVKIDSTDDDASLYTLRKRLKRADGFTAALPEPQRGPGVQLAFTGNAPVVGDGKALGLTTGSKDISLFFFRQSNHPGQSSNGFNKDLGSTASVDLGGDNKVLGLSQDANTSGVVANLSAASALSINEFRQAFQLQRLLERDERSGVQYVSTLLAHFGVRSPDARLQRPEYLGGGSFPIQVHSVANTSGGDREQASLAAFGLTGVERCGFTKSFVEHGYVFGLASIRSDNTYQQGIPKNLDRWARFDYYWPVFAHLGEEAIKNRTIYAQGTPEDDEVFGYQERYWDYRYSTSKITGDLRSTAPLSLDSWHLAQNFTSLPKLNAEFLEVNVPMSRVRAVTDGPDFLYDSLIQVKAARPLPLFGIPGMVDHF